MNITEFKNKLAEDASFAEKFINVKTPEDLVKLAAAEGYSFTVEDVENASELSDDNLDAVAGGLGLDTYINLLKMANEQRKK